MDLFYKPPLQRHDECEALEENYMNCLLQKAMRDRVFNNRCVMDSILWFHLECPKNASKFDDPIEFKRKFRDFFAQTRTAAQNITSQSESARRIRDEYEHNLSQQIYVSDEVWDYVTTAKSATVSLLNTVSAQLDPEASGAELSKALLGAAMELKQLPTQAALKHLKAEVAYEF